MLDLLRRFAPAYIAAATLATPAAALEEALLTGTMERLEVVAPMAPPVTGFVREDGSAGDLSDYAGQVVVLNFWATWCAPCRAEMPSLQALDDALGDEGLAVVPIAFGRHNPEAMARFWEEAGIETLPLHRDPETDLAQAMGVPGLPTTIVLDREGRVVARLKGEADWAAPETLALMRALLRD